MKDEDNILDNGFGPLMSLFMADRPFGMLWTDEEIDYFLQKRGYKLIVRKNDDGEEYTAAVKPGDSYIPEEDNCYDLFQKEIKTIILEKLLS